jgi:hypothetical protein
MPKFVSKRELIEPHKGDKRYTRRNALGQFTEMVNLHRSLSEDDRRKAKTIVSEGQGNRGDEGRKRSTDR